MPPKSPLLLIAGAAILAALGGIVVAVNRPATPDVNESPTIATSPSPPPKSPSATPKPLKPSPILPASPAAPDTPKPSATPVQTGEAQRDVESCVVKMAMVKDPNPPLNVRSGPSTTTDIVGTVANGTFVTVEAEEKGWFRISEPTAGWISQQQTSYSCGEKVERVSFAPNSTLASITDQFIGTGSHTYRFGARQGQDLKVIRQRGPFPRIIAPDGSELVQTAGDSNRPSWTGTLGQTGDYQVVLESNYKGYFYSFDVEIK
jgi:Bacterial SH3 domain